MQARAEVLAKRTGKSLVKAEDIHARGAGWARGHGRRRGAAARGSREGRAGARARPPERLHAPKAASEGLPPQRDAAAAPPPLTHAAS